MRLPRGPEILLYPEVELHRPRTKPDTASSGEDRWLPQLLESEHFAVELACSVLPPGWHCKLDVIESDESHDGRPDFGRVGLTSALHPRRLMIAPGAVGCKRLLDSRLRCYSIRVTFTIELEREDDGRWIAEVPVLAGVLCYGRDRNEAVARVQALALRVIAERLEHGETPPELLNVSFQAA